MESQKFLTRKFVRENTNNFYYQKSRKIFWRLFLVSVCLLILSTTFITTYMYKRNLHVFDAVAYLGMYSFLVLSSLLLIIGVVLFTGRHLFPKNVFAFMKKFREYNNLLENQISTTLKNAEEIVLVTTDGNEIAINTISLFEDKYTWLHDAVQIDFYGHHGQREAFALMYGYINALSEIKWCAEKIGIKISSLQATTVERIQQLGVKITDEDVFQEVNKILTAKRSAVEYRKKLQKHFDERKILQTEIDEYFAALTRPGLVFEN